MVTHVEASRDITPDSSSLGCCAKDPLKLSLLCVSSHLSANTAADIRSEIRLTLNYELLSPLRR